MGKDADYLQVVLVFVSPEKSLSLIERNQQRIEIGPVLVIYGVEPGLCGDEVRAECVRLLDGYDYRGNDTIRFIGDESPVWPEQETPRLLRGPRAPKVQGYVRPQPYHRRSFRRS